MLDLCFDCLLELVAEADVAILLVDARTTLDVLGFEGGLVIAFGAARFSLDDV